jgi:hypothetical protein
MNQVKYNFSISEYQVFKAIYSSIQIVFIT